MDYSEPCFETEANALAKELKSYSKEDIQEMMKISEKLADLNYERYNTWDNSDVEQRRALAIFTGDAYTGLDAWSMREDEIAYAQDHLRILSGLYGVLRPLDIMKAYRLEMGRKLKSGSLYSYWGNKITEQLNKDASVANGPIVNLASNEYFKSVNVKLLDKELITPVFKEKKGDKYRTIGIYAKKARGMMTRFIIENRIEAVDDLLKFDMEGYHYNSNESEGNNLVFTRE
jgi:cytoplasmic iron level regulating protein YaaA (DUF328/UPF0246 family)